MIDWPTYLSDSWISLAGAAGALIVLVRLPDLTASPEMAARFRACLWVIVTLMVARVGHWAEAGWLFSALTYGAAALIPLMALLIAEGMMRRHGPVWLKRFCGWGGALFVALAILPTAWMEFTHVAGLLAFQLAGLGAVATMVLTRDAQQLSPPENTGLNRMVLSFGLILPFLATDYFSAVMTALPARLGGVAVLGLCLLTINANRSSLSQRRIVFSMAALLLAATTVTGLISLSADLSGQTPFRVGAVILSSIMLMATWQGARALQFEDRTAVFLREIARASGNGPDAALSLIRRGALAPDAARLTEAELTDFDLRALRATFAQGPVRSVARDRGDEQLDWLFSRFEVTHALRLKGDPLDVVVFNAPALGASAAEVYGLAALQRAAAAIADRAPEDAR